MDLDLIDRYRKSKSSLSAREKAELEAAIWKSASAAEKRPYDMDAFLRGQLGGSGYSRGQALLGAGELAAPLWRLIDEGKATSRTGYEMLRRARQIAKDAGKRLNAEAVKSSIHQFSSGSRIVTPRMPRSQPRSKSKPSNGVTSESKRLWAGLREQLAAYVMPALQVVDDNRREQVLRSIDVEFAIFQAKVVQALSNAVGAAPTRAKILGACQTLGLSPPRVGKPINLKEARRRMHVLARAYHPDHTDGDERKAELYRRTVEAFEVLQRSAS